jgi:hypothetical protein
LDPKLDVLADRLAKGSISRASARRVGREGLVSAAATLVAGELMSFTAFGIGQALLHRAHAPEHS